MDNPLFCVRDAEVPGSNPGSPTIEVQVSRGACPGWLPFGWGYRVTIGPLGPLDRRLDHRPGRLRRKNCPDDDVRSAGIARAGVPGGIPSGHGLSIDSEGRRGDS